ncbi:MAG TPA: hypothetical protein O0W90_03785, partial [Methanocorpusculum sp.]|nr:hypothetical protein [Methanocorpusculum sp.]
MKRDFCNRYEKLPFKAILLSMLIIFVCASAFCGCVSADTPQVSTFEELESNIDSNQVILTGDITLNKDLTAKNHIFVTNNKGVTLDLGGHTLTFETSTGYGILLKKGGNLTVKDSSKKKTGVINITTDKKGHLFNVDNGTLYLESGTFKANITHKDLPPLVGIMGNNSDSKSDYSKFTLGKEAKLVANGTCWAVGMFRESGKNNGYGIVADIYGKIESNYGGITVQGELKPTTINENVPQIHIHDGAEINISKSNYEDTVSCAVYGAGYGNWTFDEKCIVTGPEVLSIKSGNWTINGGIYTCNGEYCDPATANGDGTEPTGAAVSITHGGETVDAYIGKVELIIKDGTFISKNQSALFEGKNNIPTSTSALSDKGITITGGTFTTKNSSKLYPIHIMNLLNKPVNVNTGNNIQLYPNFNLSAANWTKADDDNLILTLYEEITNLECINLTLIKDGKKATLNLNGKKITSDKGHLLGWNKSSVSRNVIDVKQIDSTVFEGSKAYYPLFGYYVTFNNSSGSGTMDNQSFVYNEPQKLNASTF